MAEGWQREAHLALIESNSILNTAELLVAVRKERNPIANLDAAMQPASLEESYAIQDAMAKLMGPVGGWKIGAPTSDAPPMFGPMPLHFGFIRSGETLPGKMSRMRGVEAEIGFLLRKDMPIRDTRYTRADILEAIGSVHPVIEVLESAYTDPDAVPKFTMVADLQMNGGFVHGAGTKDWQSIDIASEELEMVIDGTVRWEGVGKNTNGPDLLRLLEYLANEGQYRTGGLQVGQWITTGSWMGKLLISQGSSVEARFKHFGAVAFSFAK